MSESIESESDRLDETGSSDESSSNAARLYPPDCKWAVEKILEEGRGMTTGSTVVWPGIGDCI